MRRRHKRLLVGRVAVGIPAGDSVKTEFALSLASMLRYTQHMAPRLEVALNCVRSSILPSSRQSLCEAAIEQQCSHVLMIDSDMAFPRDTLIKLLLRCVDVIGVNATTRKPPFAVGTEITAGQWLTANQVQQREGIESVYRVGMGLVLVAAHVLDSLDKPWFDFTWQGSRCLGEDYYFYDKCREKGHQIWVDHDIPIGHVGSFEYTTEVLSAAATG